MERTAILPLLTFLLACLPGLTAQQATWTAQLGFGTTVPFGTWSPLRVTAAPDAPAWTLEVLPAGAQAAFPGAGTWEIPVFVPAGQESLTATVTAGGWVRQKWELAAGARGFPGHLVLVGDLGPGEQAAIGSVLLPGEPVRTEPVPASDWPRSALAWEGVSAAVLRDPGPVLAPAQVRALGAWLASGGRLVLEAPLGPGASLADQLGPTTGLGRIVIVGDRPSPGAWKAALGLVAFGQVRRLGTDFGPPAVPGPAPAPRIPFPLQALLAAWAAGLALLAVRKKARWAPALAWTLAAGLAVLAWGPNDTDRGLVLRLREVILPSGLGRYVQTEVLAPCEASPWALAAWKRSHLVDGASVVAEGPRRLVTQQFLPPAPRTAGARVRGTSPEVPEALAADRDWVLGVLRTAPDRNWAVGGDSQGAWVELLAPEAAP
jgi:hypothetical protein